MINGTIIKQDNKFKEFILPAIVLISILSLGFGGLYWFNSTLYSTDECAQYIDQDCVKYCNFNGSVAARINTDCNRLGNIK